MPDQKPEWDIEEQDYAALAEEASDPDAHPWKESDWDADAVKNAKQYASKHHLSWPPGINDFDRWYDMKTNGELK